MKRSPCITPVLAAAAATSALWQSLREAAAAETTCPAMDEHDVDGIAGSIVALPRDPERADAMARVARRRDGVRLTHDHTARRLRAIMGLDDPLHDTTPLEASVT